MNRECEHVKRGMCATCAEPLKPKAAHRVSHVTDFGNELITALRTAGYTRRPHTRRPARRNRTTNTQR